MELFDEPIGHDDSKTHTKGAAPLAYRMSPKTIDQYVGQEHIVGEGKLLRRAIEADRLSSIILYGPPGTGKTALARVIANMTRASFRWLNAAVVGLDDLRKVLKEARQNLRRGIKTILFLDEIHRFNKLQQDALLPDVEEGVLTLIAATVENPFFYVNSALVSRSQIFELKPLGKDGIIAILKRAAIDTENGLGAMNLLIDEDAYEHFAIMADGDARKALNALEIAALTTQEDKVGEIRITKAVAEESVQKKAVLYDKKGDQHYDTISAFIKSMRGGDADATTYYLARMIYAGEDPRFIARRIIICASEDVGDADPMALVVSVSALRAVELVGMPEGRIPLAHAAIYVANSPKSNACYVAIESALKDIETEQAMEVPDHLKSSAYASAKKLGRGVGYVYPHDHPGEAVRQEYIKKKKTYYKPYKKQ